MAKSLEHNVKVIDKEDRILIVIMKDGELLESSSGKSQLLAKTKIFENIGDISGDDFEDKELGLNLVLTVRPKKATKTKAKTKPEKAAKKKKPRLDDDDED